MFPPTGPRPARRRTGRAYARQKIWGMLNETWDKTPGFGDLVFDYARGSYRTEIENLVAARPDETAQRAEQPFRHLGLVLPKAALALAFHQLGLR